jgi:cytochrome c biogenesis protein CcdA
LRRGSRAAAAHATTEARRGDNSRMLRLIGLVVSIGLADSLNPSTIAPALYLATGERAHARAQVTSFTFAVFAVYLLGGLAIALGPGQLLLSLIPHPGHRLAHIIEVLAGITMLVAAAVLWRNRDRLAQRDPPELNPEGRSSFVLGATITAVELPTAFPYFAAIAAIVGSGFDPARQVVLLVLFNVCFVLPLIGIAATLAFGGDHAERLISIGRNFLQRHWPTVLAVLALLAGLFVTVLGVTGIGKGQRNTFGRFSRRIRRLLHLHP